jgi:nucleoid-associated protein YgaU
MTLIARRYYDDGRLAEALATYNKLPAPDKLRTGLRLLVPPREALVPKPSPTLAQPSTTPLAAMQRYTVQSGDTLSELAQKLLGTAKATNRLWSMNKATLKSPDALRVGMELRYTPSATP